MKISRRFLAGVSLLAAASLFFAGCISPRSATKPPLLLISLDGFRWDYCALHPAETPHLRQLMREGVSARGLIPVFPSNTFPNHYTIVTGLYPSHHGLINNQFFDPTLRQFFYYNVPATARSPQWWGGEPIWVTAVQQGRKSATSFWPGSESEIKGMRPTFWQTFNYSIPFEQRLDELDRWLRLPTGERPAVITFYLEETNSIGHLHGPNSAEMVAAIKLLDGRVGAIMDRLQAGPSHPNVVIVSDHGMTPAFADHVLVLDDYLDLTKVQVDFEESVAGLRPLDGNADVVLQALATIPDRFKPHFRIARTQDLPTRLHLDGNPRLPPVWVIPDEGWEVDRRKTFEAYRDKFHRGQHGYDPAFTSMHGIFIARGPSFKTGGIVLDEIENVHVYNLLCAALGLKPAANDGDDRLVRSVLR